MQNLKRMWGDYKEDSVVLLQSGGLDSCVVACILKRLGFNNMHHVFINYGQNALSKEWECAQKICKEYGGTIHKVDLNMPWLSTCAIVGGNKAVSRTDTPDRLGAVTGGVYVPMRNHIFISVASSLAESLGIRYIATGIDGAQDFLGRPLHGTPDKHPNFVKCLEKSLSEGSCIKHIHHNKFEILCPLIGNEKVDTIHLGLQLECDFSLSWTCYNTGDKPCMQCDSCLQRAGAFDYLGKTDPLLKYL